MIFNELNNGICKTYLVGCRNSNKALLVDPIYPNIDRYLAILGYHGLTLDVVLDTHTHADHRSACAEISRLTGCKISRHATAPQPNVDIHLDDGSILPIGELNLKILHTPGHTPDSISIVAKDRVLSGDCLLIGGTGRTDFAAGDAGMQYDSISEKLFKLPDNTLLFPSHDYRGNTQSTIGHEKLHNPRVANKTRDEYIQIMTELGLPLPEKIQEVLQINATDADDTEIQYPSIAELNKVYQLSPQSIFDKTNSDNPPLIIDVRQTQEFSGELGHIQGAKLIPLPSLANDISELTADKDCQIITVCRAGVRSTTAAAILTALGYTRVNNLKGGMMEWRKNNLPVER